MGSIDIQIFLNDQWHSNAIRSMSKDQLRKNHKFWRTQKFADLISANCAITIHGRTEWRILTFRRKTFFKFTLSSSKSKFAVRFLEANSVKPPTYHEFNFARLQNHFWSFALQTW